jgi:hypothetical protein
MSNVIPARDPLFLLRLVDADNRTALYLEKANNTGGTLRRDFFKEEYRLNHLIATMKTNYISILDGITSEKLWCPLPVRG